MRHLHLFEAWSSKLHALRQGAYQRATATNKAFGRAAKSVLDYAEREISSEKFSIYDKFGITYYIEYNAKFLLQPLVASAGRFVIDVTGWSGPKTDPNSHLAGPDCFSGNPFIGALKAEIFGVRPELVLTDPNHIFEKDTPKIAGTELHAVATSLPKVLMSSRDYQKALFGESFGEPNREAKVFISEYQEITKYSSYEPVVRFKTQKDLENFLGIYVQAVMSDKSGIEREINPRGKEIIAEMGMENTTDSPAKNACLAVVEKIIKGDIANFL